MVITNEVTDGSCCWSCTHDSLWSTPSRLWSWRVYPSMALPNSLTIRWASTTAWCRASRFQRIACGLIWDDGHDPPKLWSYETHPEHAATSAYPAEKRFNHWPILSVAKPSGRNLREPNGHDWTEWMVFLRMMANGNYAYLVTLLRGDRNLSDSDEMQIDSNHF